MSAGSHVPRTLEDGSPVCRLIAWEVTRSCNLACRHCRAEAHPEPYPGELSTEEALKLIASFPKVGRPIVIFTGGEPTLRADLFELISATHKLGLTCACAPNGTRLTPEMAHGLKDAGVERCSISIDGADARRICRRHARYQLSQGGWSSFSDQYYSHTQ